MDIKTDELIDISIDKKRVGGKVSIDDMLQQLRTSTNCVTRSVLVDCIIDRLKRRDYM